MGGTNASGTEVKTINWASSYNVKKKSQAINNDHPFRVPTHLCKVNGLWGRKKKLGTFSLVLVHPRWRAPFSGFHSVGCFSSVPVASSLANLTLCSSVPSLALPTLFFSAISTFLPSSLLPLHLYHRPSHLFQSVVCYSLLAFLASLHNLSLPLSSALTLRDIHRETSFSPYPLSFHLCTARKVLETGALPRLDVGRSWSFALSPFTSSTARSLYRSTDRPNSSVAA
jgi:hypothetical protein